MNTQYHLFTDKKCDYCGKTLVPSQKNPNILNAIKDMETGYYVCWSKQCRELYCQEKNVTK